MIEPTPNPSRKREGSETYQAAGEVSRSGVGTLKGQPGATRAALFALCPCCGSKGLFAGMTQFAEKCPSCGLDYSKFNVGDGPAAFLTLIIGAAVATLAILVELKFEPPFWVHAVLWIPITSAAVLGGLRAAKAWLLGAEFRRDARQGKLKDGE